MSRSPIPARDANFPAWQTKVALAVNQIGSDIDGSLGAVLPLVDGSIPPVFIQNSDGSLVYAELD